MIEGIDKRIIVVGGGPTGLYSAYLLKKLNPNIVVSVFEEHKECGLPVCCSGLIDVSGYESLKLKNYLVLKDFLINKVYGANVHGPLESNLSILSKNVKAYVIDRNKFDNSIKKLAKSVGVDIWLGKKVISVDEKSVSYKDLDTEKVEELRYDFLIAADGPNSVVRETFFKNTNKKDFYHTYQVVVNGNFENTKVSLYLGDFANGLFAWVVPESKYVAKIGLGVKLGKNPKEYFLKFKDKFKITYEKEISECSGILPITTPLSNLVYKNILLVGDAGCFVKPTTGGGVNFGLRSAEIAANTINNRIKSQKPLSLYNKNLKKCLKELALHYKIRNFFFSKTIFEQDKFLLKIKNSGVIQYLEMHGNMDMPSKFLFKLMFNKDFFKLFPEIVKFFLK